MSSDAREEFFYKRISVSSMCKVYRTAIGIFAWNTVVGGWKNEYSDMHNYVRVNVHRLETTGFTCTPFNEYTQTCNRINVRNWLYSYYCAHHRCIVKPANESVEIECKA